MFLEIFAKVSHSVILPQPYYQVKAQNLLQRLQEQGILNQNNVFVGVEQFVIFPGLDVDFQILIYFVFDKLRIQNMSQFLQLTGQMLNQKRLVRVLSG